MLNSLPPTAPMRPFVLRRAISERSHRRFLRFVPYYLALAFPLACQIAFTEGYRINLTASLPRGLYRLDAAAPITRGALIAICPPMDLVPLALDRGYLAPGNCPGGSWPLLKCIGGLAGDTIELTTHGITVNHALLPDSLPLSHDRTGLPLKPITTLHLQLTAAELWVYAPHPYSWDSRYFGPLSRQAVVGVATPILAFP